MSNPSDVYLFIMVAFVAMFVLVILGMIALRKAIAAAEANLKQAEAEEQARQDAAQNK